SIQGRSYKVIPQVARVERLTPDQLSQIYVTGSDAKLVPLSTFASLRTTAEPRELKKFQQLNAVRIQGVIPPPVPLDKALSFLENEAKPLLPQGFTIDYAGESRQLRAEGGSFLGIFLLSAVLIYLVLAAQFESFRDPFIILAGSVPLAVAGALLFSFLGLTTLNIYSQVGLITLVGLVSKNGILIVQFANHLQETGASKLAAVIDAASTRLRPILMTTPATSATPLGADTLTLPLEDAVRRAVEHNPDLAIVRLGTEVEAANVGESRTAYTPIFSTTLGRSNNTTPPTNFLLGNAGVDTRDWFSSTGFRQRVPWGNGTWSASWDASRTTSNSPLTSFDPSVQSGVQFAFSQPLVRDR